MDEAERAERAGVDLVAREHGGELRAPGIVVGRGRRGQRLELGHQEIVRDLDPRALAGALVRILGQDARRVRLVEELDDRGRLEQRDAVGDEERHLAAGRDRQEPVGLRLEIDVARVERHALLAQHDRRAVDERAQRVTDELELHTAKCVGYRARMRWMLVVVCACGVDNTWVTQYGDRTLTLVSIDSGGTIVTGTTQTIDGTPTHVESANNFDAVGTTDPTPDRFGVGVSDVLMQLDGNLQIITCDPQVPTSCSAAADLAISLDVRAGGTGGCGDDCGSWIGTVGGTAVSGIARSTNGDLDIRLGAPLRSTTPCCNWTCCGSGVSFGAMRYALLLCIACGGADVSRAARRRVRPERPSATSVA